MDLVGSYEAKTHLPKLLERVAKGERITITKHGIPVAMLVPVRASDKDSIRKVIDEIKKFRCDHSVGGQSIRAMINEGRRY